MERFVRQMFMILVVFLGLLANGNAWGQNTLTIHDGTVTNSYVPVYGFYTDAYLKCEFVYPASELTDMVGSSISSMKFYLSSPATDSWGNANFQVFLKEISGTTISTFSGAGTVVYEGALDGTQSTMTITFTIPYLYNGGSLLIGLYNTVKGSYKSASFYGETVNGASVQGYSYSSLDEISPTQRNFLPKVTFEYTPDPSVCQKPNNPLTSNITSNSATISWSGNATSYNIRTNCKRYNFDTGFQGWTTIDADGDGHDWIRSSILMAGYLIPSHQGIDMLSSQSYDGIDGALNPDNYLVSPLMQFGEGAKITFWVAAQDEDYAEEHFGVAISTNGNINPNDFTTIAEWTNPQNMSDYLEYTVDLSSYSGQGYVAIRHFDCTDMFYLNIDDITICEKGSILIENVSSPYTITNLSPETEYTYLIESDCGNGNLSTLTSINFNTTYLPLQFLDIVEEPVCWDFEDIELLTMPNRWTNEGDSDWTVGIGDYSGSTTGAHSGNQNLLITHTNSDDITYLCLPLMDLSNIESGKIIFWFINRSWAGDIDELDVCYRINNGNWISLFHTADAHSGWTEQSVNFVPAMFTNNVQIGFKFKDNYGYGVGLDDICLELYDVQNHLLPITLRYFNATPRSDGKNLLKWVTAYESQNSNFEICRTRDILSNQWEPVVTLWQGMVDKPYGASYQWLDEHPYDTTYYILVQNDLDGGFETFRSEYVVCIQSNLKSKRIEPYVTVDNAINIINTDALCDVYVYYANGGLRFQKRMYPNETKRLDIRGFYMVEFIWVEDGDIQRKVEKVVNY